MLVELKLLALLSQHSPVPMSIFSDLKFRVIVPPSM